MHTSLYISVVDTPIDERAMLHLLPEQMNFSLSSPSDNSLDAERGFLASCLLCVSLLCCVVLMLFTMEKNVFDFEIEIENIPTF